MRTYVRFVVYKEESLAAGTVMVAKQPFELSQVEENISEG